MVMKNLPLRERSPMQLYYDHIQRKLRKVWKPIKGERRQVDARFVVARDGSVSGFELVESSGDAQYDAAARSALEKAAPFDPWPAELAKLPVLQVRYLF